MLVSLAYKHKQRVIGPYAWSSENGHVCRIDDAELLQELFTNPAYKDEFSISPDDELAAVVGDVHTAQMLIVYGRIASVEQLARLSKEEAKALANTVLETVRTVSGWAKTANEFVLVDGGETAVSPPNE